MPNGKPWWSSPCIYLLRQERRRAVVQPRPPHPRHPCPHRQFLGLAEVPPELAWFATIQNPRTREAYQLDLQDFMRCAGMDQPKAFRLITRAHVIAGATTLPAEINLTNAA
jgi:hypothetical protein